MARKDLNGLADLKDLKPEDIDSIGESYGERFADKYNGIKTNQVRNIYSSIIAMRVKMRLKENKTVPFAELKKDLVLLKPKLAYAAGRQKVVRPLYDLVSQAITITKEEKGLSNFIALMEAIVAYHKFYGGKDK